MQPAKRLARIPTSFWSTLTRTIAQLQAGGLDVIRLDIGGPDLPPSAEIIDAMREAVARPELHGYSSGRGRPELRSAIAEHYQQRFGVRLDPETELTPLMGSKEGLAHIAWAFVDPGDIVLVPEPAYPTYRAGTCLAGGDVVVLPLRPENGYLPDLDAVPPEAARRAKILWLNYPHNPTGASASLELFRKAVEFARRYDLLICHDAPYACVAYDGYEPPSILQVAGARDVAIEFNSLSKTYNMAGWRVAMAVGSREAIGYLTTIKGNVDSGMFAPTELAAAAALRGDQGWLAGRNAIYQERRDIMVNALTRVGMKPLKPKAGLYVWAAVLGGLTSEAFVDALLRRTGVSVVPGSMYGEGGEGYVRLSVTAPTDRVAEAMDRLEAFVATL